MQKEKSTGELLNEIAKSDEINLFLQKNEPSLSYPSVASCLAGFLRQKQLSKAVLADRSGLDRVYVYQILAGRKSPSRRKLAALALALHLTLDETQHLLQYGQTNALYPRSREDSILIYALQHQLSVIDTNDLLYDAGLDPLV